MSLQLWLPLNGNLTNQGLSELSFRVIDPTYTTISSQGKIGSCYINNTGTNGGIVSNEKINLGINQSMFCWAKINTFHLPTDGSQLMGVIGNHNYGTSSGMGLNIKSLTSTTGKISISTGSGTSRTFTTYCSNTTLASNTWYHIGYTYDGNKIRFYLNGNLDGEHSITNMKIISEYLCLFAWAFNNNGNEPYVHDYKFNGALNDVRVYDHCLSPKEVKEISKGLMLHYPLNNNGFGRKNIAAGNFNAVATQDGNTNTGTLYINKDDIGGNFNNLIGKTLVFSYEVSAEGSRYYTDTSNLNIRFGIHGTIQYTTSSGSATSYPFADYLTYSGGSRRVIMKYTIPSTWTSISNFVFALQSTNRPASGNTATWYIKNCKLEIADTPTSWCPNQADTLYTQLGLNKNIEYDVSGYGNNGTRIGTLDYEINSPRYNMSSYFNGTDACIKVPELTLDFNNITFSMWYKPSGALSFARLFDFSMGSEGNSTTFLIAHYSTNMQLCIHGRYPNKNQIYATGDYVHPIVANTWYHVACTVAGTVCKWYIDGKLVMTKTMAQNLGVVTFVNNYLAESTWAADPLNKCNLSDFRIYSTCLSDSDIQELYNKPISIDNNGNLYAQEIIEEVSSASKLEKSGVVKANNIGRCSHNYFTYDNTGLNVGSIKNGVSITTLPKNNGIKLTCTSAISARAIICRTQNLLFNGASGNFKVEFDAWSTAPTTIICDICDKEFGKFDLTTTKQHFSGVAQGVNAYNTSSSYNGFFDIENRSLAVGTEIYITNIVITKYLPPQSIGNNFVIMEDIIEN